MRQVDGSDLLGQNDPRNAEIGILHVEAEDSRQEILTAINAQELLGRKQIAIVLPEQGKAFRQPVEFDGLKNMRRGLKAQLIFIAPSGPGPAEFARQRRFMVYSSLETFKTALLTERGLNPRAKAAPADEKKQGFLGRGRASRERGQNPPPTPRLASSGPGAPVPPMMPPPISRIAGPVPEPPTPRMAGPVPEPPMTPPTPRIVPGASVQPMMPPTPPTPRSQPAFAEGKPANGPSAVPSTPIEEMDTHTLDFDVASVPTVPVMDDDDDLAPPPATPRQPQSGGLAPDAPGGGASPGAPRVPGGGRPPAPLLLGQQTSTPRPGGSGKLPAASAQGTQDRSGAARQPAGANRGGVPQGQRRGTKQLPGSQNSPDAAAPKQPDGKNGNTNKTPAIVEPVAGPVVASGSSAGAAATAMASSGSSGGPVTPQRQVALAPQPPLPASRRQQRRKRNRLWLLLLLLLLVLTLALAGSVWATGGFSGLASLGHLTATVTITPRSQVEQDNYIISGIATGTPAANQRQVAARVLTAQSAMQTVTGTPTGKTLPKQATGTLTFSNSTGSDITLGTTTLTAKGGIQIQFNGPVVVPALSSSATAPAFAVQGGTQGDIPAHAIFGSCCAPGIGVQNASAFSGGQDPQTTVQKTDVDNADRQVVNQLTTSTLASLQSQIKSNERVVDNGQPCSPVATSTPPVGAADTQKTFSVSVFVKCTEEVFDFAAARQIAVSSLTSGTNLPGYQLVGQVITDLLSSSVVNAQKQVNIDIQASGKWVYQVSNQMRQQIKTSLAGQSKDQAQNILRQYQLASATINISSGSTMPATASDITVNVVPVPGLQPGTPTSPTGTPAGGSPPPVGGTPAGSPTPASRPTNTPQVGS